MSFPRNNIEERFYRQHLNPLYLRNKAYAIYFLGHFLVSNYIILTNIYFEENVITINLRCQPL